MHIEVSKVTSKGQITIPKFVREQLDLHEGDKIAFIEDEQGHFVITKSSSDALRNFFMNSSRTMQDSAISEAELLRELEEVRTDMLHERKQHYSS